MNGSAAPALPLEIAQDVALEEGYLALSNTPWLRLPIGAVPQGAFVEIRYASSFYDAPVRPLLRFLHEDGGFAEQILPAPCEGAALWIGRTPAAFSHVWISPTNRPGRFDFRVESIRPAPLTHVLLRAARTPKRLFFALAASLLGWRAEADLNWRFALGAEPLVNYPQWRALRQRDIDANLDRPRSDWRSVICVTIDARGARAHAVDATRRSIEAQSYAHCHVALVDAGGAPAIGAADYIMPLRAGDWLEPHACACFAEHFARAPETDIAFCDEIDATSQPRFKPAWSATLHRFASYVGRGACFRAALLGGVADWPHATPEQLIDQLLEAAAPGKVGALHRPLLRLGSEVETPPRAPVNAVARSATQRVSLIIPTRDRADLLEACIGSVRRKTSYQHYDIVVIDNDSVQPRSHALFEKLQADARIKILTQPGPFNFSALCNAGAQAAPGNYLLFLNNDTEVVTPDWIERLLYFAEQPDIGAVGAKLLYPSGDTQHAGVVLGMGGVAGHFGAGLPASAGGWFQRNLLPHDVAAVTGACLLVARSKFDAVDGFDAVDLPVEFNDIDLCLRLAAKGWRTVCNTQAVLLHHQAASRSQKLLKLQWVYEKERRAFSERWRVAIRDDPWFHPGLSLYAAEEELP